MSNSVIFYSQVTEGNHDIWAGKTRKLEHCWTTQLAPARAEQSYWLSKLAVSISSVLAEVLELQ